MKSSIESVFRAGRAQKSKHKYTHWMHVIWIHGWCPIAKCATRPAVKQWNHHKSYVIAPMFGCACVCECVSIWITINQKHKDESCEAIALMTWKKRKKSNQIEDETGQCDVVVTPIVNSTATGKKNYLHKSELAQMCSNRHLVRSVSHSSYESMVGNVWDALHWGILFRTS